MTEKTPVKVAVIGGGCASMAAAFELSRPEHQGRYEITVYQLGWRIGGKGASGRDARTGRIEEHGLHLWMGFYENAFRVMRECYAELDRGPDCPIRTWDQAFYPDNFVGVTERLMPDGAPDQRWINWTALFPPAAGNPGDPLKGENPFTIQGYMARCALLLRCLLGSVQDCHPEEVNHQTRGDLISAVRGLVTSLTEALGQDAAGSLRRALKYGQLAAFAAAIEALNLVKAAFESAAPLRESAIIRALDYVACIAREQLGLLIATDHELRRVWEIVDVVLAIMRGVIRDGLLFHPDGFEAIDQYDWREWLRMHGASEASLDSAFIRGSYDLLFAYEEGDIGRPALAAGQALRGAFRMFFTYRGALFWKMSAGMGDIVFTPFYEVLKRRGVKFEFFHRLQNVGLADDRSHVASLDFDVQAKVKGGKEYQPLVDIHGLPCWPSAPDYAQLVGGARLKKSGWNAENHWDTTRAASKTLKVSEDFDLVVLGVGLGEVPHVCREIVETNPVWETMVREVKTVATQAFQIWMNEPMDSLGWELPPINISGFVEPFDTWADMRQLIEFEDWSGDLKAIAYFCSVLPDSVIAEASDPANPTPGCYQRVRDDAVAFLDRDVHHLWPRAVDEGGFRWGLLLDDANPAAPATSARFDSQYWTANVSPTERYVLSLPGSLQYRISPLDQTYDNLTVAGDWTDCGHQAGCVEAAVMSGLLAAHALSQQPPLERIVGFDHP